MPNTRSLTNINIFSEKCKSRWVHNNSNLVVSGMGIVAVGIMSVTMSLIGIVYVTALQALDVLGILSSLLRQRRGQSNAQKKPRSPIHCDSTG